MFKNYLKIALRNLKKHKGYSLINIAGLAIGMACCIIIFLYIDSESTYDQFNLNADRIYRVAEYRKVPAGEFKSAKISPVVAKVLKNDFPQVKHSAMIMPLRNGLIKYGNNAFFEERIVYADQAIFDVFTIPFLHGDPATALISPRTMVLTERMAEKYFGSKNPIGEIIQVKDPFWEYRGFYAPFPAVCDYIVTGVVKNSPSNSHFKYNIILSLKTHEGGYLLNEWHAGATYTYIQLSSGVNVTDFENRISGIAVQYIGRQLNEWGQKRSYFLQPLVDIHYQSHLRDEMEPPGNILYLYIYSVIGFLVLLIGCMNFINLSNAKSIYRINEIGVRKMIGAGRGQLISQLLWETLIITGIALSFAFLLSALLLPVFNETAGTELTLNSLHQPIVFLALTGLIVGVVILAGGYPAYILTKFRPGKLIKGISDTGIRSSLILRTLVVGQFVITIIFMIGTITVYQQLHFMKGGALGFAKEQKYVIPFRMNKDIRNSYEKLKNEFIKHHAIIGAAVSSSVPGSSIENNSLKQSPDKLEKPFRLKYLSIDYDFIPEYQIEMRAGRTLLEEMNDAQNSILVNEEAVRFLGYKTPEEAIGKKWYFGSADGAYVFRVIVGITKNFHYQGMKNSIEPLYMSYNQNEFSFITLTLSNSNMPETLKFIERTWKKLAPSVPCEGFFLNDNFNHLYHTEEQVGKLLGIIAGMGLLIACLGLFGLAAFTVHKKTKEIGIRKVLGSSVYGVVEILSKDFTKSILLANLIAWPIAYFAMSKWLQNFAYRTTLSMWIFILSGLAALAIALLTVSYQTIRAARANPVDSLRYE